MGFTARRSSRRNVMKWGVALGAAAAVPGIGGWRGLPVLAWFDRYRAKAVASSAPRSQGAFTPAAH